MTSDKVYKGVRQFVANHEYKLENVYVHAWEADSFSVTSSAYAYEVEVKCSRSDFFADFKKPKHNFFKSYKKGAGILSDGESWRQEGWEMKQRMPELKDFCIRYTNIKALKFDYKTAPNKFFYACPPGMIEQHEVPEYAGLIYIMDSFSEPRIIKKAPFLHKDPIDVKQMLFDKFYWLHIEQKNKIRKLESEIQYLKEGQN